MLGQPGVEEGLVPNRLQVGHHDVRRGHLHESGRRQGAGGRGQGAVAGGKGQGASKVVKWTNTKERGHSLKEALARNY